MKQTTTTKTRESLLNIINLFENGNIPEAIVRAALPMSTDIPMAKWSFRNRLICALNLTCDARGFNQWKEVGRYVKKGSRNSLILKNTYFRKKIDNEN